MLAQLHYLIALILLFGNYYSTNAVKCLDCVGKNCMGAFCEGDYCINSQYAPRWGTIEWGEPRVVKGCMHGGMLRKDVRSHCEVADENDEDVFTCFCNNKNYCNDDKAVNKLEIEPVQLLTCVCEGAHCKGPTCIGELCSYVINHKSKQTEQGCVNASVPFVERRLAGACMIPPMTGAMHHTVAKNAEDLLVTESCVCGTDYCNNEKPEITVPEKMKCQTFVKAEVMGTKMESRNVSCTGEFCFKAQIKSNIGHMTEYNTIGCASFIDDVELAEELNPTGCAKFESENVQVEACMRTDDKRAIGRARENQQIPETVARRPKPKSKTKEEPKTELSYEEEEEEEEKEQERMLMQTKERSREEKEEEVEEKKAEEEMEEVAEKVEKEQERMLMQTKERSREEKEEEVKEKEEEPEEEPEEESEEEKEENLPHYIFEKPTESSTFKNLNAIPIAVFLLLMLLIAIL